jgi:hypothetical protein
MAFLYLVCAVLGGTVLLCQFAMTLLGLADVDDIDVPHDVGHGFDAHAGGHDVGRDAGADHAHDHHHGSTWFFGVITFRTVVAALTFFGLSGMAARSCPQFHDSVLLTFVIALGVGLCAMYGVHWMMQGLHRLKAEGTVQINRAVGHTGSVYLRVPGQRSGAGKVTLSLQNRTVEYQAMTNQDELPTGAKVVVVGVIGPDTVEVEPAPG